MNTNKSCFIKNNTFFLFLNRVRKVPIVIIKVLAKQKQIIIKTRVKLEYN